MTSINMRYSAVANFISIASASWVYRSRPDLSPPTLNITIEAKDTAPGYLFLAPYAPEVTSLTSSTSGAYIFTDSGDLVWSGFGYFSIWGANFQKTTLNGEDVLFSFEGTHNARKGHGHGHVTFLNKHYETVKETRGGGYEVLDKHEFHVKDGKTGLATIYHTLPTDLTAYGGEEDQQWVIDSRFQEIDLGTGELLFEWSSVDHIPFNESAFSLKKGLGGFGRSSGDAWDFFHINSVDKDEAGDYLISARHVSSIYKISGKTGKILWRIGGLPGITPSDFELKDGLSFSFQHHARFISTSEDVQVISFFDNSAYGTENGGDELVGNGNYSSSKIIEVNTKTWEVKQLYRAPLPYKLLSKSQGSTQVLDNGHVITGWGSVGAVTEFNKEGEPIFHAFVDSGPEASEQQNYRAFKYEWVGEPTESIAVVSEATKHGDTNIYVSWNGDTRTTSWKFFAISSGKHIQIGEKKRSSFETTLTVKGKFEVVYVEAYSDSKFLSSSRVTPSVKEVVPFSTKKVTNPNQSYFEWKGISF